jgi:hypothetical protein
MSRKSNTDTPKRGRGRPASFPDQDTVAFLATIPVEVREQLRQLAAKRSKNINQVLAAVIERGFKDANRKRSAK